jgi:hypothetical protein
MDCSDQRARREQVDYRDPPRATADLPLHFLPPHPSSRSPSDTADRMDKEPEGYTLMVAGRRTGKTAFLRLLLDTSVISPSATQDQLHAVAKFVQGCAGFTSHVRSVSVNIDQAVADDEGRQEMQTLFLTLIDTPALDFEDENGCQRVINDILRYLDARFSESVEDVSAPLLLSIDCALRLVPAYRSAEHIRATIMSTCEFRSRARCGAF